LALLEEIREELRELRLLYKELVEKLVPVEEALDDEKEAIEASDEIVSEEEVMEALEQPRAPALSCFNWGPACSLGALSTISEVAAVVGS